MSKMHLTDATFSAGRASAILRTAAIVAVICVSAAFAFSQNTNKRHADPGANSAVEKPAAVIPPHVASSPAYAEILLARTEFSAELESLLVDYTDEYPRVKELRSLIEGLMSESARLAKVKASDAERLTLALGKLMVRKVELGSDLSRVSALFQDEHPEVKRAKRKFDSYEAAIKEILGS